MSPVNGKNYNQIAFALEILKLLAEKPRKREELAERLADYLEEREKSIEDVLQKLTRTIRKLRECGFSINSAPHHPYELLEANFPLILSPSQRQALFLAARFLAEMGFQEPAGQIARLGGLSENDRPANVTGDFSPPVDYSEEKVGAIVASLQEIFRQKCRYSIFYRNRHGESKVWDLDRSELRFHNGVLYLFGFVPDAPSYHIEKRPNLEQNYLFRVDRIDRLGGITNIPWFWAEFPTLTIRYRLTGTLATYQPRRDREQVIDRDLTSKYVEIETKEDYLFWFQQRILQYGSNARVIEPEWLARRIREELKKAYENYP